MDGEYQQCTSTTAARMGQFGGTFAIGPEANARISALANCLPYTQRIAHASLNSLCYLH